LDQSRFINLTDLKISKVVLGNVGMCLIGKIQAAHRSRVLCVGSNLAAGLGIGLNHDDVSNLDDQNFISFPSSGTTLDSPVGEVTDLASGFNHYCAVIEGRKVFCWGQSDKSAGGFGSGKSAPALIFQQ
jgi:hypothetical protein